MKVGSMITKKIAQNRIDNLFMNLNEQNYMVEYQLQNNLINTQTAVSFYETIYSIGLEELNSISSQYNLQGLKIDDSKIYTYLNYVKNRAQLLQDSLLVKN